MCGADLLRLRVCLCVVKIVFLKKSSDFFSCFVLAKFRQLGDCRCGNNSPPAEGRATKWRGG